MFSPSVRRMKIRSKLVVTMVSIALVSLAMLAAYANWLASNWMLSTTAQRLEAAALGRIAQIININRNLGESVEEIARGRLLIDSVNLFNQTAYTRYKKRVSRILARSIDTDSAVQWLEVSNGTGELIAQAGRLEAPDDAHEIFEQGVERDAEFAVLTMLATPSSAPLVLIEGPVHLERNTIGRLRAALSADAITVLLKDRHGLGDTGTVSLVRHRDQGQTELLAHSLTIGEESLPTRSRAGDLDHILSWSFESRNRRNGGRDEPVDYQDASVIVVGETLPNSNLGLVLTYDVDEALRPVEAFRSSLLGFGLFVAALAGLVGVAFARSLSSPISHLVGVVTEIRQGNLHRRADISASDEIGQLAVSFNDMTDQLVTINANLEQRVSQRTAALDASNRELETRAAELVRSNAELQQFASIASHDLREPLRKVQAFGDRLQSRYAAVLDERGRDYVYRMRQSADRMQVLIADLLAYSRVSSRREDHSTVDLALVVKEVCSDLEFQIQAAEAVVDIDPLPDVEVDAMQMRQIFQNFLSNSVKYVSTERIPRVHVWSQETPEHIVIHVEDNGIGFEPQYKDRIFEIFQRLHGRDQYQGTGIGLAICRKIAENHDGWVEAQGRPSEGARFSIALPVSRLRVPAHAKPPGEQSRVTASYKESA